MTDKDEWSLMILLTFVTLLTVGKRLSYGTEAISCITNRQRTGGII